MSQPDPSCFFCKEPVDDGEFCHGCGFYVCVDCDAASPEGSHELGDHKLAEQDEEFSELDFN